MHLFFGLLRSTQKQKLISNIDIFKMVFVVKLWQLPNDLGYSYAKELKRYM